MAHAPIASPPAPRSAMTVPKTIWRYAVAREGWVAGAGVRRGAAMVGGRFYNRVGPAPRPRGFPAPMAMVNPWISLKKPLAPPLHRSTAT